MNHILKLSLGTLLFIIGISGGIYGIIDIVKGEI